MTLSMNSRSEIIDLTNANVHCLGCDSRSHRQRSASGGGASGLANPSTTAVPGQPTRRSGPLPTANSRSSLCACTNSEVRHRIAWQLGMPPSTMRRVLRRHQIPWLCQPDRATSAPVRAPAPVRCEMTASGELVHVDSKKLGRISDGAEIAWWGEQPVSATSGTITGSMPISITPSIRGNLSRCFLAQESAREGTRTPTTLRSPAPKAGASAISPPGHVGTF